MPDVEGRQRAIVRSGMTFEGVFGIRYPASGIFRQVSIINDY